MTVNSRCVGKLIVPFEAKIPKNNEPANRNIPRTMNEKIKVDKLILESILLKKPLSSTPSFVPHSEQKSPS